jgi:hypothetical protein
MESEPISKRPTVQVFLDRAKQFHDEYPEESGHLLGELMLWGAAVVDSGHVTGGGTLADMVASQIDYSVQASREAGSQITTEEFVEGLFSENPDGEISADIIMGRLQLG